MARCACRADASTIRSYQGCSFPLGASSRLRVQSSSALSRDRRQSFAWLDTAIFNSAAADDVNAISHASPGRLMRNSKNRKALFPTNSLNGVADIGFRLRIEAGGRLVQDQQARLVE